MVAHKRGSRLLWADDATACPNVLQRSIVRERLHPNEKPVSLVAAFLQLHTKPGQLILDPFCGSGTTLYTAKGMGRQAIGVEISEEYCEVSARRLDQQVLSFGNEESKVLRDVQGEIF